MHARQLVHLSLPHIRYQKIQIVLNSNKVTNCLFEILFSRTPGSRQPSPGEEEFQKNATLAVSTGAGGVVLLKPGVDVMGGGEEHFMTAFAPAPPHHLQHHQAPPAHHLQHLPSHAAQLFGAQGPPQGPPPSQQQQQQQQQQGPPQPQDTTGHFDVQVSHGFSITIARAWSDKCVDLREKNYCSYSNK